MSISGKQAPVRIRSKGILLAAIAALVLLAATWSTANAEQKGKPFYITGEGTTEQVGACTSTCELEGAGTAQGAHLGKSTYALTDVIVTPVASICDPDLYPVGNDWSVTGTLTFTAANGDSLTGSVTGRRCEYWPTDYIDSYYTVAITGGTGKFTGATGTLLMEVQAINTGGIFEDSFTAEGAINY